MLNITDSHDKEMQGGDDCKGSECVRAQQVYIAPIVAKPLTKPSRRATANRQG